MSTWVITNQKGGVAKTTTSVNLAYELSSQNKKVLLIDLDPQANASSSIGVKGDDLRSSLNLLIKQNKEGTNIIHSTYANLDVIPSIPGLIALESELIKVKNKDRILRNILKNKVYQEYDFIFIDTPPALGVLTINALVAAKYLLVPIQAEYLALEGLGQLLKTVSIIKRVNPDLKIAGMLITMFSKRTNLSKQVEADLREHFGDKVFKTVIPRSVRLAEAPSFAKPISIYRSKSTGAIAYQELAQEILNIFNKLK